MKKMMNRLNRKDGFTLAELLIVVAIIAVLVAVSIPIFTSRLEKAREATDLANLRAAYAAGVADYLGNNYTTDQPAKYYNVQTGMLESSTSKALKGTAADGGTAPTAIGEGFTYNATTPYADKAIKVTIKADGKVELAAE
ncbi:prepilin-type N-terminal cleavage/methylation domain-containing protein [Butyrivibrio hungatei DSM 14810]|uniref:Prepilin-type N-terminal cleavage/methylation domain-containing protein n=1 Tax=Butyrivibrio hungatei DSM 14810 TaxID=1121132 RepID=A0A1M7S7G6_9FIRM|nr:prepilin-type N-terminal cleavage/methylation domain-containing protein [Butyrivibrio hungatei]SHN54406.1 prepilin-type N-terminal cleavage/methylation domain-containing protein [Butyrivibrio hungatei DSM 14810]